MRTIFTAFALAAALTAAAQTSVDVLTIELNDGTTQTIDIDDIKQMYFETLHAENPVPTYTGTVSMTVGGTDTYQAENHVVTVIENSDGTLDVEMSPYSLADTKMGDLTLGHLTIRNIAWDESKKAYYRNYSDDGLMRSFTAVRNGVTTMNDSYPLGETSEITLKIDGTNIEIQNDFKLGNMPMGLASRYTGQRK